MITSHEAWVRFASGIVYCESREPHLIIENIFE